VGDWEVRGAQGAVERWERTGDSTPEELIAFYEWVFRCIRRGPPTEEEGARRIRRDLERFYLYRVPGTEADVAYYVVVYEQLVIVKDIWRL
jgi:hypothetical protein